MQRSNDFSFASDLLEEILLALWGAFVDWWWVVLPLMLFYIAIDYWRSYRLEKFKASIDWVVLSLGVPRDVEMTPKAMEQVFSALSVIASSPEWREAKLPLWVSFEMVGSAESGISFYIRAPREFRKLIETQLYSQYSQMEIIEVEDYTNRFESLPNNFYDTWGISLELAKENVLPIKTYEFFEESKDEKRLDPLAPILEILSHLKETEEIWIQIVVRALTKSQITALEKEAKAKIEAILGKKAPAPSPGALDTVIGGLAKESWSLVQNFLDDLFRVTRPPETAKEEKKEEKVENITIPGERKKIDYIEEKLSKPLFETGIRVLYLAPKTVFDKKSQSLALKSYFQSFTIPSLNGLKEASGEKHSSLSKKIFGDSLGFRDAEGFFGDYVSRELDEPDDKDILKKVILSTVELATLYHFPLTKIGAPRLYRLQTKKYEPPSNLPLV